MGFVRKLGCLDVDLDLRFGFFFLYIRWFKILGLDSFGLILWGYKNVRISYWGVIDIKFNVFIRKNVLNCLAISCCF